MPGEADDKNAGGGAGGAAPGPGQGGAAPAQQNGGAGGATDKAPTWVQVLPAELRENASFRNFKDIGSFARSALALEKKATGMIAIPGPEATDAERAAYYTANGRPEKADGYDFAVRDGASPEFVGAAKEAFHTLGLSKTQAAGLAEFFAKQETAVGAMREAAMNKGIDEVKAEWGHAFEANQATAQRAVNQLCTGANAVAGLDKLLDDVTLANHPAMLRLFHTLGVMMGEDTAIEAGHRVTADEQDTLRQKIDAMLRDPNHPLNNGDHPGHKAAVAEKTKLYQQLYGDREQEGFAR